MGNTSRTRWSPTRRVSLRANLAKLPVWISIRVPLAHQVDDVAAKRHLGAVPRQRVPALERGVQRPLPQLADGVHGRHRCHPISHAPSHFHYRSHARCYGELAMHPLRLAWYGFGKLRNDTLYGDEGDDTLDVGADKVRVPGRHGPRLRLPLRHHRPDRLRRHHRLLGPHHQCGRHHSGVVLSRRKHHPARRRYSHRSRRRRLCLLRHRRRYRVSYKSYVLPTDEMA